jgi:hypothetical protein
MKPEIVKYCAQDVALLPELYKVYNTKLCPPGAGILAGSGATSDDRSD